MVNSKKLLKSNASIKRAGKQVLASQPVSSELHPVLSELHSFFTQHLTADESSLASSPASKLLLALSGGLDSSVLLHLLVSLKPILRFELHALHVHHGLSPNADAWAALCMEQCQSLDVPIRVVQVNVDQSSKLGIEAEARQMRYQALFDERLSIQADFVVTAHHQDDQAETFILQLMRGAGVKGLSSMAEVDRIRSLIRPLLRVSRQALYDYAIQNELQWCDDESNDNTQYERNFVRHDVMPILQARYPSVKSVLSRTASHLAEANALLNTLAEIDAQTLVENDSVCLQGLSQLSNSRAKNLLRWWFAQHYLSMPTSDHLAEMLQQLLNAKPDAELSIKIQHYTLRRYQQRAYLSIEQINEPFDLVWNGENELMVPNGGKLIFRQVEGAGLALKFGMTRLRITNRSGGERFKPDVLRPTRTLKHLLQAANIPPWQRDHLPLIYWQDTLACVPGVGVAHELRASKNELGLDITWQALGT
ncbi:tRNA lysidine(34) synthetase TilS [Methylotenera sp.]|uniref:tRNA lysidine(34) synthetase TilS n=1 Tax=Methylotenera sp. TaxID=2051956 RepID=UPI002736B8D2|nr:tRNA lysidine(34) synthetase TilS [Methylotenera sp.]MDP3210742.1 tRNA lysidine(34) synthetase TilS [Methylotenera sp.]